MLETFFACFKRCLDRGCQFKLYGKNSENKINTKQSLQSDLTKLYTGP